jgi:tight adherence protein B
MSGLTLAAALVTALAVALLVPGPPGRGVAGPPDGRAPAPVAGTTGSLVLALALLWLVRPALIGVAIVAAGGVLGGTLLWRARRARQAARRTSALVLEVCELIGAELAAGQPPGRALERAADTWRPLAPVAEAFRMGADVPDTLRMLARNPGAADLRLVAAAWQVAHRTGQGLARAVEGVAADLRAAESSRRVVEGELASARATARMVAGLPLLALAMGSGAGGSPWAFLLGSPPGLACLAGGLALGLGGVAWIEAIARDVDRR